MQCVAGLVYEAAPKHSFPKNNEPPSGYERKGNLVHNLHFIEKKC